MASRCRIIANAPGPFSLPPEIMTLSRAQVDTDAAGWDVMRETLWVPYSPYFAAGERRDEVLLPELPTAIMVVQTERVVGIKGGYPVIELTSMGIARPKPWKCVHNGDSYGAVTSGGVQRNLPTVNCYWFSTTLESAKIYIPWPAVPPETFGYQATGGTTGTSNNVGWFIIRREVDPLAIVTGTTDPKPWKDTNFTGGGTRPDVNRNPRPALCSVVDYYVYDPTNVLPPND